MNSALGWFSAPRCAAMVIALATSLACAPHADRAPALGDYSLIDAGGPSRGSGGPSDSEQDAQAMRPLAPAPAKEGTLTSINSAGRAGAFYLPEGYNQQPIPLAIAYHGTGGSGRDMVAVLRKYATAFTFAIVAPDSRVSPAGQYTWQVGDSPGDVTEDYAHTLACIAEFRAQPDVRIDPARVLAVGYSGGGSSAPYIATNEAMFRAYAVLHGGVIEGGIGRNMIAGWFSTGTSDALRPPELVQQSVDYMNNLGFTDATLHLYPGGHEISAGELDDLIAWWLADKPDAAASAP